MAAAVQRTYQTFVNEQTVQNPSLQNLKRFLEAIDHDQTSMTRLDFFWRSASPVIPHYFNRNTQVAAELRRILASFNQAQTGFGPVAGPPVNLDGQILIIEDLTTEVVEILGSQLDIDPLFFSSHIYAAEKTLGSQTADGPYLPSRYSNSNFLNLHYHRTIQLQNPYDKPRGNITRRCNVRRKLALLPEIKETSFALVQHCCSILRTANYENRWLCIILVDPGHSSRYRVTRKNVVTDEIIVSSLFQRGYEEFLHPPRFSQSRSPIHIPARLSLRKDLEYYWMRAKPQSFEDHNPSLLALCHYSLKIVAAEWINYIHIINHCVKEYEFKERKPANLIKDVNKLNTSLIELQVWRRRFLSSRQKLQSILHSIESHEPDDEAKSQDFKVLKQDFEHVISSFHEYSVLMENMLGVCTSFVSLLDARKSFALATALARFSIVAFLFAPLSLVSGILGNTSKFGPSGSSFSTYFAVAIPITAVVYLVARPPHVIAQSVGKFFGLLGIGRGS